MILRTERPPNWPRNFINNANYERGVSVPNAVTVIDIYAPPSRTSPNQIAAAAQVAELEIYCLESN